MAGGGKGRWMAAVVMFVASLVIILPMTFAATSHVVGGSEGWIIPRNSTFYASWSSSQNFSIGDSLVFNFPTGAHTVVEVPKSSFDACTNRNQVGATHSTGPATITLASDGDHYYICSIPGHCSLNQKLTITVAGGAPGPSTPNPSPLPGDSPLPAPGPVPPPTAGGPPGSGSPGGGSAAPPASRFGFAAAAAAAIFLAFALR